MNSHRTYSICWPTIPSSRSPALAARSSSPLLPHSVQSNSRSTAERPSAIRNSSLRSVVRSISRFDYAGGKGQGGEDCRIGSSCQCELELSFVLGGPYKGETNTFVQLIKPPISGPIILSMLRSRHIRLKADVISGTTDGFAADRLNREIGRQRRRHDNARCPAARSIVKSVSLLKRFLLPTSCFGGNIQPIACRQPHRSAFDAVELQP